MPSADLEAILDHMLREGIVFEDEGMLSMGPGGEATFGYRNFMDLFSIFSAPPLFKVLQGRKEIGQVHQMSFFAPREDEPLVLTLGGRHWSVKSIDWSRQTAQVVPAEERGRSRWIGSSMPMGFELCQSMANVLAGEDPGCPLSRRAEEKLAEVRGDYAWLRAGETAVVWDADDKVRWWTFAGLRANTQLATQAEGNAAPTRPDRNLFLDVREPGDVDTICDAVREKGASDLPLALDEHAMEQVKFRECLPPELLRRMLRARWVDEKALEVVTTQPRRVVMLRDDDASP